MEFRKTLIALVLAGILLTQVQDGFLPVFRPLVERVAAQTPLPQANLSIQKTGPITIVRGSVATYVVTAGNAGPDTATNVVTTDLIPSDLDYVSYSASEGVTCAVLPGTTQIQCQVGFLPSGITATINLNFTAKMVQDCTSSVTTANTVTVQTSTSDPVLSNNAAQATTTLTCPVVTANADLAVTLSGPTSVTRNTNATYTALVTNNGPMNAQSASLQIPLPSSYTFVSSNGASCSVSGTSLACTLGTVTSGQSTPIVITYNVPTISNCLGTSTIQVSPTVSSSTTDPNPANSTAQITTTINCDSGTANLSVYKTDNRSTANANETLHYSIIITNNSSTAANNVFVIDQVPYGLTILGASDGGSVTRKNVLWYTITVGANSSRTLTVDARVRSDVKSGTVIRNGVYVSGQTSWDDTMIDSQPYYAPYDQAYNSPFYLPSNLRYDPPSNPPYDPPSNPPVYKPPRPLPSYEPPVILPRTGAHGTNFYASRSDRSNILALISEDEAIDEAGKVRVAAGSGNVSTTVAITLLTMFALGFAILWRCSATSLPARERGRR